MSWQLEKWVWSSGKGSRLEAEAGVSCHGVGYCSHWRQGEWVEKQPRHKSVGSLGFQAKGSPKGHPR